MDSASNWQQLSHRVAELCVRIPATAGPAVMARELAALAPELTFREVLSRGGWYRLGGVVDAGNAHLSDTSRPGPSTSLPRTTTTWRALRRLCRPRPAGHPPHRPHALFRRRHRRRRDRFRADRNRGTAGSDLPSAVRDREPAVEHRGTDRSARRGPDLLCRCRAARRAVPGLRRLTPVAAFLARMRAAEARSATDPSLRRGLGSEQRRRGDAVLQPLGDCRARASRPLPAGRPACHAGRRTERHTAPKFAATFGMQGLALHDRP
jgi:hypothetical protein